MPLERDYIKHFYNLPIHKEGTAEAQCDTWNFNEYSFRIEISGKTPSETNRDFVSILHLDLQMLLKVSESSYSNDQIALDYIKHFNKFTKLGLVGEWRLLIYNGHSSHLTHEFITSHVLQPLHVVVFQPYKYFHKKRIEVGVRHGTDDFNKVKFLHYIYRIRKQAFKPATIKSAFKKTGIWPLNGDIVIDRLPTVDVRRATPPPPPTTIPVSPPTPVSAVDIIQYIQKHLQGVDPYTGDVRLLNHRVIKLAKAAVAVAAAREMAETDLRKQTMAAKHRQRRQIPNKRVVQKGGTVYDEEKGSRHKAVATLNALKANDPPRRR
ncbi:hypothetical protein K469DRAFT_709657 [Zopfia rhizophila CBS 207.26]|uniref:DDE-1 domain-containing protein n=1 Tax=Zopfia rhizophila CBS 207.26 TaxID=1314779 RepID=A0A6A6EVM8_9PEZI|nr:hypothetical protein K469DRAFT_709657 [Zopfia rhizophila CBS 207.26]